MSWIVIDKRTKKAVLETFNPKVAAKINKKKYKAMEAGAYLRMFNKSVKKNSK